MISSDAGCEGSAEHAHGVPTGATRKPIFINSELLQTKGPFNDPAGPECGFGKTFDPGIIVLGHAGEDTFVLDDLVNRANGLGGNDLLD